jgi:hypothetical protein
VSLITFFVFVKFPSWDFDREAEGNGFIQEFQLEFSSQKKPTLPILLGTIFYINFKKWY